MAERYSYSRIDLYTQCGFKYKLRYEDKHYVNTDGLATELGTLIHETEEALAEACKNNQPINYPQLKNKILLEMIKLEHKYPVEFSALDKSGRTCQDKILGYLKEGIYRLENFLIANGHIQILATEKEFEYTFPGTTCTFHGFIDRILYDSRNSKFILQDIKTYNQPLQAKKLKVPLQFVVYALAMPELYGATLDQITCSYDLPFCNCVQSAGEDLFIEQGTTQIQELLQKIADKDFVPSPSPLCHWCEYCPTNPNQPAEGKNLCPYHSLWTRETKNNAVASHWAGLENHELVLFEYLKCQNCHDSDVLYNIDGGKHDSNL